MINVIMHGCNGRMGAMISDLIEKDEMIQIVAGVDPAGHGRYAYPVFNNISDCDVEADVVIDFSNPSAVEALLDYCVTYDKESRVAIECMVSEGLLVLAGELTTNAILNND